MGTTNIFQKSCPSCAAQVPTEAATCGCGYSFAHAGEAGQDEELIEAYLAARLDQAVDTLEAARIELKGDPKNPEKLSRLMRALHELQSQRAEIETLSARAAEARKAATPVQSVEPTEAFRAAQAAKAAKFAQKFSGTETKQCPKCRTALPAASALCFCGFVFARNAIFRIPGDAHRPETTAAGAPPKR